MIDSHVHDDRKELFSDAPFVGMRDEDAPVIVGDELNAQKFTMLRGADVGAKVTIERMASSWTTRSLQSAVWSGWAAASCEGPTVESNSIVAAGAVVLQN